MKKMKKIMMIGHIAKTELQSFFYSPIAWLILVVVAVQTGMAFAGNFGGIVEAQDMNYGVSDVSSRLFGRLGLFGVFQRYLFIYIPLLTMGLISRELSNGSIKLLYSSPVNNTQIVLGKYFAMLVFGLLLIGIPVIYVIFGYFTIEHFELGAVLTGLLGLYLLVCTYSAVGLFMSSLTSYQIVAVVCTITLLGALQAVGMIWQDVEFFQEITYWLALGSRTDELFQGLMCSEDVLYFIIVSALFLSLAIVRLRVIRQKETWLAAWSRYIAIFVCAMLLGYLTTRPQFMTFYDATHTKRNTLTPSGQEILSQLEGGLTITAYNNILDRNCHLTLPRSKPFDKYRFRYYWRFKPEIKLKYVYYYDKVENPELENRYPGMSDREKMIQYTKYCKVDSNLFLPPEEIRKIIDLSSEGNRFLRVIERENGQKTVLRTFDDNFSMPTEKEISAALQRLSVRPPVVGFLESHGARNHTQKGEQGYSRFSGDIQYRYALINNGFDIVGVQLDVPVPQDVDILVLADLKSPLADHEMNRLKDYIARGGNLVIAGDVNRQSSMNPIAGLFGVTFGPGQLVKPSLYTTADIIIPYAQEKVDSISPVFLRSGFQIAMPGCTSLAYSSQTGYSVIPLFVCDSSWNKSGSVNFIDDTIQLDRSLGETIGNYATVLALSRKLEKKEQKIVILGDSDCLSNGEIERRRANVFARNLPLVYGMFHWLSDGQAPLDVRRPQPMDNKVFMDTEGLPIVKILSEWVLPGILLLFGIFVWIRRRGK